MRVRRERGNAGAWLALCCLVAGSVACSESQPESILDSGSLPTPSPTTESESPEPSATSASAADPGSTDSGAAAPATSQDPNATQPDSPVDDPPAAGGTAGFPFAVSADDRFIVDGSGAPWMMLGDSPWSLIAELDQQETEAYLDNRQANGFNTVLVNLLEARFSSHPPDNAAGVAPFTGTAFQSPINEEYFEHVDQVIAAAADRGITVLLCAAYLGYDDSQGFGEAVRAASDQQLGEYGATIGARYASAPNIIWLMGGDRALGGSDDDQTTMLARTDALATGIRSKDSSHLMTFHTGPEQRPAEIVGDLPWLDLDNVYTYSSEPVERTRAAIADEPRRPVFWMEGHYENDPDIDAQVIRAQAWASVLAGGLAGHVFGNDPIWNFGSGGIYNDVPITWEESLDGRGSIDMRHLSEFIRGVDWSRLETDVDEKFVTSSEGSGSDAAAASWSSDLGIVYVSVDDSITVDLALFTPDTMRVRWYDPTSGEYLTVGDFDTTGETDIEHPGDNSQGDPDWVLVVDVA